MGWDFTCRDQFEIAGRGTVYVVDLPDDLWSAPEPPKLAHQHVRIDTALFRVRGVEMPCVPWRPSSRTFKTVGLLADPA